MASNLPIVSVLGDFTQGPPAAASGLAFDALDTGDGRGISAISTSRGRSYELAGSQAGTASIQVDDPQETLNPANPGSPFNADGRNLELYRGILVRAYWPRDGNLASSANLGATTYHPGYEIVGVTNGWRPSVGTVAYSTTAPYADAGCLQASLSGPSATLAALAAGYIVIPGKTHTWSAWVKVASSAVSVFANIGFQAGVTNGYSSTATSSTDWVRLSVTFPATAPRATPTLYVTGPAGTNNMIVYLDQEEMVVGDTPAAVWQPTGPIRYPIFTGYIERYPVQWVDRGFRGVRPLECVDALSVLSRTIITDTYDNLIAGDNPTIYLPLDDESGPGRVEGRLANTLQLSEFVAEKGGAIAWQGDTQPDGTRAVALSQQLQNPADLALAEQVTELDIRPQAGPSRSAFAIDTRGATLEFWARVSASVVRVALQGVKSGNFSIPDATQDSWVGLNFDASGQLTMGILEGNFITQNAVGPGFTTGSGYSDGEWHYFAISLHSGADPTKYAYDLSYDDNYLFTTGTSGGRSHVTIGVNSVLLQALTRFGDPLSKASISRVAFYPRDVGQATRYAHFWRGAGHVGEFASDRCRRLLADFWGPTWFVDTGSGLTLPSDQGAVGSSVLSALEDIVSTDQGVLYVSRVGNVTVESRATRYRTAAASLIFGEDADNGETPYDSISYDYDPGNVYSSVSLTRPGRQDPVTVTDTAVQAMVGQRVFSKTLQVQTDFDLEQAAKFYLHRYGQARMRVSELVIDIGSRPEMWPRILGLEISARTTVRRRTAIGLTLSEDYYIESIKHDIDVDSSTWRVTLQLSPVFVDKAWKLGDNTLGVLGASTVPVY